VGFFAHYLQVDTSTFSRKMHKLKMKTKHQIKQPNKEPPAQMPPPIAYLRQLFRRTKKKKNREIQPLGGGRNPPTAAT
jgi:hypothetical protein